MSAPVDVLARIAAAWGESSPEYAAVAEMIERARETLERFDDDYNMSDLRAALARCGGAK